MNKERVQKTVYLPSREFEEQVTERLTVLGFGSFSAYVNHLIANDNKIHSTDELNQIQRNYKANIRMYRDFSFSLQDAKEYAKRITLLTFGDKFEGFIKNLD